MGSPAPARERRCLAVRERAEQARAVLAKVPAKDKGNADTIMGMEVQGLAIPAHGKATAATASSRELRRSQRPTRVIRPLSSRYQTESAWWTGCPCMVRNL